MKKVKISIEEGLVLIGSMDEGIELEITAYENNEWQEPVIYWAEDSEIKSKSAPSEEEKFIDLFLNHMGKEQQEKVIKYLMKESFSTLLQVSEFAELTANSGQKNKVDVSQEPGVYIHGGPFGGQFQWSAEVDEGDLYEGDFTYSAEKDEGREEPYEITWSCKNGDEITNGDLPENWEDIEEEIKDAHTDYVSKMRKK